MTGVAHKHREERTVQRPRQFLRYLRLWNRQLAVKGRKDQRKPLTSVCQDPMIWRVVPRDYEYLAEFKDLVATSYEAPSSSPFVPGAEAKAIAEERQMELDDYLSQLPSSEINDTLSEYSSTDAELEDAHSCFTESDTISMVTTAADPDDSMWIQYSVWLRRCAEHRIRQQWGALSNLAEDLPLSKLDWIGAQVKFPWGKVAVYSRRDLEEYTCCECGVPREILREQRPCASCNKKICKRCFVPYIPRVLNRLPGTDREYESTLRVMTTRADFENLCQCENDFKTAEQKTIEIGRFCRDCVNKEIVLPSNPVHCSPWLRRLCPFGGMEDTNDLITPYCRICLKHGVLPGYPRPLEWTPDLVRIMPTS
ncbi:hypothetical protein GLAREA_03872 [Glarea lozoyensis ATCC 20868]|uniref:Uncharacterized protein n=1 Tax=Glarea lozoyensis (strain ATCC 20868 / MF5171) TaxID=1116229 RepID=S3CZ80_GLAL2|nr:uncharacterized protein GLAREA_03872 [Glarea lozoyensis ATCC 20868]EPE30905.1 hypothetical protein GLAREA_03872 [Glarea lozoyensis ATCC 20868]